MFVLPVLSEVPVAFAVASTPFSARTPTEPPAVIVRSEGIRAMVWMVTQLTVTAAPSPTPSDFWPPCDCAVLLPLLTCGEDFGSEMLLPWVAGVLSTWLCACSSEFEPPAVDVDLPDALASAVAVAAVTVWATKVIEPAASGEGRVSAGGGRGA